MTHPRIRSVMIIVVAALAAAMLPAATAWGEQAPPTEPRPDPPKSSEYARLPRPSAAIAANRLTTVRCAE